MPSRSRSEPGAGRKRSKNRRATHSTTRPDSSATLAPNSVVCGAISNVHTIATPMPNTTRATRPAGVVFGSVIMKNRKIEDSGENTITHQKCAPHTGSNDHRAVMQWPEAARDAHADREREPERH